MVDSFDPQGLFGPNGLSDHGGIADTGFFNTQQTAAAASGGGAGGGAADIVATGAAAKVMGENGHIAPASVIGSTKNIAAASDWTRAIKAGLGYKPMAWLVKNGYPNLASIMNNSKIGNKYMSVIEHYSSWLHNFFRGVPGLGTSKWKDPAGFKPTGGANDLQHLLKMFEKGMGGHSSAKHPLDHKLGSLHDLKNSPGKRHKKKHGGRKADGKKFDKTGDKEIDDLLEYHYDVRDHRRDRNAVYITEDFIHPDLTHPLVADLSMHAYLTLAPTEHDVRNRLLYCGFLDPDEIHILHKATRQIRG